MAFRGADDTRPRFDTPVKAEDLDDFYDQMDVCGEWARYRELGAKLVPGIGNSTDPLAMVVGEAPGAQEELKREPFIGPSGHVLSQLMALAGLYARREVSVPPDVEAGEAEIQHLPNVFLTNTIKYLPRPHRTPTSADELWAARWLREEWRLCGKPRLIIAVGSVAGRTLGGWGTLPNRGDVYPLRGKTFICHQYHPAYGLRNPSFQPAMERHWEEMGKRIEELQQEGLL